VVTGKVSRGTCGTSSTQIAQVAKGSEPRLRASAQPKSETAPRFDAPCAISLRFASRWNSETSAAESDKMMWSRWAPGLGTSFAALSAMVPVRVAGGACPYSRWPKTEPVGQQTRRLAHCLPRDAVQVRPHRRRFHAACAAPTPAPEPSAPSTQESELRVREALAKLDSADREILMLREYKRLSYGDSGRVALRAASVGACGDQVGPSPSDAS